MISAACRIPWADVTAVASTVCKVDIRKRLLRRNVRSVDAIADPAVWGDTEAGAQNAASDDPCSNINYVIGQTAPIWESRRIASDQSETASLG